jgi:hypothetical protein
VPFTRPVQRSLLVPPPFVQSRCPTGRWFRSPTRWRAWVPTLMARRRHSGGVGPHEQEMRMPEGRLHLSARDKHYGAKLVARVKVGAAFTTASRPCSRLSRPSSSAASPQLSQVASVRAWSCSSAVASGSVARRSSSACVVSLCVVAPSGSASIAGGTEYRSNSGPNE